MIRHWVAAYSVYTDEQDAAGSPFGRVVAPPMMLRTWTMATVVITGAGEAT